MTFNWYEFFSDPIVLAIISSGVVITFLGLLLKIVFKLGAMDLQFKNVIEDVGSLKEDMGGRMETIEHCIIEIQTVMKAKFAGLNFTHTITKYGVGRSPIRLRDEYMKFITVPKLDKQIKSKNNELLKWLKDKKPSNGLDAQDHIIDLVVSENILDYLKLDDYKQNLYEKGKTSEDADGILFVYLFDVLIPQLNLPDAEKKTIKK